MLYQLGHFLLANLVILLLYAPGSPRCLRAWRLMLSYWQGQLKLGEALRSVAISFTSGPANRGRNATRLLVPFGLLTLLAILAFGGAPGY